MLSRGTTTKDCDTNDSAPLEQLADLAWSAERATKIEMRLCRWFARRLGMPATSGGYVMPSAETAAVVALKAARDARAGWSIRELGTRAGPPLIFYASADAHGITTRAADMLGLGRGSVRAVPLDEDGRMRPDALRAAVARDVRTGHQPVAVIATAGSIAAGTIDPLDEIADVCTEYGMWMHVDTAYGAGAALTDELRPHFRGIERADSVAFDPDRWLDSPHFGAVILVRDLHALADD
jgi:glutamate/tyrosine decarboxylase-like PLP-dependent enzyme